MLVIYQDIKNVDFTVPIPKVTDPLNEKESRGPKFRSVISWSAESFVCYSRSLYKDAVCGRSSILLEALTQRAKRRKNPFIIHEATV